MYLKSTDSIWICVVEVISEKVLLKTDLIYTTLVLNLIVWFIATLLSKFVYLVCILLNVVYVWQSMSWIVWFKYSNLGLERFSLSSIPSIIGLSIPLYLMRFVSVSVIFIILFDRIFVREFLLVLVHCRLCPPTFPITSIFNIRREHHRSNVSKLFCSGYCQVLHSYCAKLQRKLQESFPIFELLFLY